MIEPDKLIIEPDRSYSYDDWYVIKTIAKRELFIKQYIDKNTASPIKTIVFLKQLLHKRKGKDYIVYLPLFPGYIFIHKNIREVMDLLKNRLKNEKVWPISFGDKKEPSKVFRDEMMFLLMHTDNSGIFQLSYGYRSDEKIKILSGPLKDFSGKIIKIDEKKRKAFATIYLFNKEMKIKLGLELIAKP